MYRISLAIAFGLCSMTGCADGVLERDDNASNSVPIDQAVNRSARLPTPSPEQRAAAKPDRSRYQSELDHEGLYYVFRDGGEDERKLIISCSNEPIPEKLNDPDEVTEPGFYLSHFNRLDFSEIEVVGKRVYFKTRPSDGLLYEFRGMIGGEINPEFDPGSPIPTIIGVLTTLKEEKVVHEEKLKLGHAIIL